MNGNKEIASIIIEGNLDPLRAKGGLLDLKVIIKCFIQLGYHVRVLAQLAKGVSEERAKSWLGSVDLIELESETCINKFKELNARSLNAVTNQCGGIAIFMGMGAIRMVSPPKMALTILLPGLPEYKLIYPRFRYALRTGKVNLSKILLQAAVAIYECARSYTMIHVLYRKIVDIVVAQDPINARTHQQCARSKIRHYPSPLLDTAHLGFADGIKMQTVVMANAPGTHSDSAIEYFCKEISPHIVRSDYNLIHVGREVLPAPFRELENKINIINKLV